MKRKLIVATAVLLISSIPLNSFAANSEKGVEEKIEAVVYDKEKKPTKSFSPLALDTNGVQTLALAAAPYWSANSDFGINGAISTSDSYTSSTKTTKKPIDYIYAKTKAYVDGIYKGSATDSASNASHAGASYIASKNFWQDGEAVGSQKFEHAGYQSWYPETSGT